MSMERYMPEKEVAFIEGVLGGRIVFLQDLKGSLRSYFESEDKKTIAAKGEEALANCRDKTAFYIICYHAAVNGVFLAAMLSGEKYLTDDQSAALIMEACANGVPDGYWMHAIVRWLLYCEQQPTDIKKAAVAYSIAKTCPLWEKDPKAKHERYLGVKYASQSASLEILWQQARCRLSQRQYGSRYTENAHPFVDFLVYCGNMWVGSIADRAESLIHSIRVQRWRML